jgi:hypothetical protein
MTTRIDVISEKNKLTILENDKIKLQYKNATNESILTRVRLELIMAGYRLGSTVLKSGVCTQTWFLTNGQKKC